MQLCATCHVYPQSRGALAVAFYSWRHGHGTYMVQVEAGSEFGGPSHLVTTGSYTGGRLLFNE